MIGRTNTGGGGGGGGLNFQVVGVTVAPSNPRENTIWINTATKITSWTFSATEPENLTEGMVWISVGTSSAVSFNALKKNNLEVYPLSAKQYIDGELVSVPAYCYQSGDWVQFSKYFDGYLFNNGSVNEDITGGWSAGSGAMVGNTLYGDYYKAQSTRGAICSTVKKIDLTEYNTLKVNCTKVTGTAILYIETDTNQVVAKSFTTTGVTELNISAVSGEHYIRIASSGVSDGDYTVDKVWLE
jgi:hypothetical protein